MKLFFILGLSSVVDYSCTLTPLFSIEMLSNQSYILQLNFSPPRPQNGNDAYQNLSEFFKISTAIGFSDKNSERRSWWIQNKVASASYFVILNFSGQNFVNEPDGSWVHQEFLPLAKAADFAYCKVVRI